MPQGDARWLSWGVVKERCESWRETWEGVQREWDEISKGNFSGYDQNLLYTYLKLSKNKLPKGGLRTLRICPNKATICVQETRLETQLCALEAEEPREALI